MSYCDCEYDGDPPAFYKVKEITRARKQFKCEECNGPIFAGEPYRKIAGKWYEKIEVFRFCHLCVELEQWAKISMPCFCVTTFGQLHERVQEMVQDVAPTTPGFFFEYGRRMVRIRQRSAAIKATDGREEKR